MTAPSQLRVLTLNEKENSSTIFRLEKGWSLHFTLGPSLIGRDVRLFVNHPKSGKSGPSRHKYRELEWQSYTDDKEDVYDNYAEVCMVLAGSFNYFFTTNKSDKEEDTNGNGYFLVDPVLKVGEYEERVPLDAICCQTVLSKNLGSFPSWESRLRVAKECAYNMIHFTPIQSLGASNSAYCIKEQLEVNTTLHAKNRKFGWDDVDKLVSKMQQEWGILSLTDLVYNHTANESPWIQKHPECAFNLFNSPHLKPAYLLDRVLWHLSNEVARGELEKEGIPAKVNSEDHLNNLRRILVDKILPSHKIEEYYLMHIDGVMSEFRDTVSGGHVPHKKEGNFELKIIPGKSWKRLSASVNIDAASQTFYAVDNDVHDKSAHLANSCAALHHRLEELNQAKLEEVQSHLAEAVKNFIANVRWRFVDPHGEKVAKVLVDKDPLMWNYFTLPEETLTVKETEDKMHTEWGKHCMAHNGWVMGDDPLRNFAASGSNVYLRRELIPWGDSVKLRYGDGPSDCPYLWKHMREYTVKTAEVFHGVRLDNCHSTPIHVAEWMLDEARKVRPDLYVIAELFTSSERMDNLFINRLSLNSLIREGLQAHSAHALGSQVHHYGGDPVGAFFQPPARPLTPSVAHAIFFDQTHDNKSPIEIRSAYDVLPSASIIAMGCFATGSNRGHDELVPHHINVVKEKRLYSLWTDKPSSPLPSGHVVKDTGIYMAKRELNLLHQDLGVKGFSQVYVDKIMNDIVSVTRHNPVNQQSVVLIARCAFNHPKDLSPVQFDFTAPGEIEEVLFEARVDAVADGEEYQQDTEFINGLPDYQLHFKKNLKISESEMVEDRKGPGAVRIVNFTPSCVVAFKVRIDQAHRKPVLAVRQTMSLFGYRMRTLSARNVSEMSNTTLEQILTRMSLADLHRAIFRANPEEQDDGLGFGAYDVPNYGPLTYCGLQGVVGVLNMIRSRNDLGHPLCDNLRAGDWMLDYISERLLRFSGTNQLGDWFVGVFKQLRQLPRHLIPCYFDAIVTGVFNLLEEIAWAKMSPFVSNGGTFVRTLSLGSLQFCSYVPTSKLPPLSPNLVEPLPPLTDCPDGGKEQACLSLSAGLPHFASGIFRNWGRDTFIALRGLLILTGRQNEARFIILAFAGVLRHGLIPNLLGSGTHARYNCRDAIWWWLQCIQDYCREVEGGEEILQDMVARMYPTDDSRPVPPGQCEQRLHVVIQEALQRHAHGISFRERDAGSQIDKDMSHEGFNVEAGIDWRTGFVYGGNKHNCGTWMDKMGSSEKAGNMGKPATPSNQSDIVLHFHVPLPDGSAVELVGLCKSAVRWLADMYRQGKYPHGGVSVNEQGNSRMVTFEEWNKLIQKNFESHFWIGGRSSDSRDPRPDLINQRLIYKDSVGSSLPWTDYQLRPNFPVTMVVAPELFTPLNAWSALTTAEDRLVGPLGMKTLDPSDWAYDGNYINSDDSTNTKTARGWNYHQGPEWVWPLGFFLRAKLYFARLLEKSEPGIVTETKHSLLNLLSKHNVHVHDSLWLSLPELTNKDGAFCPDSCAAQAWSVSCILELMHDLHCQ